MWNKIIDLYICIYTYIPVDYDIDKSFTFFNYWLRFKFHIDETIFEGKSLSIFEHYVVIY